MSRNRSPSTIPLSKCLTRQGREHLAHVLCLVGHSFFTILSLCITIFFFSFGVLVFSTYVAIDRIVDGSEQASVHSFCIMRSSVVHRDACCAASLSSCLAAHSISARGLQHHAFRETVAHCDVIRV